jgi:hypothetical protein
MAVGSGAFPYIYAFIIVRAGSLEIITAITKQPAEKDLKPYLHIDKSINRCNNIDMAQQSV